MKTKKDASDTANYVGVVDSGPFAPVKRYDLGTRFYNSLSVPEIIETPDAKRTTHLAPFANAVTFWSHGTPENKNATGEGGVNVLINKVNSGGASLIRTGDLRIMILKNHLVIQVNRR